MRHIEKYDKDPSIWKFRRISAYEGLLKQGILALKDTHTTLWWNAKEVRSSHLLTIITADNPVTCAIYGKNNNHLEEEEYKRLNHIARRWPKPLRLTNQVKLPRVCNPSQVTIRECRSCGMAESDTEEKAKYWSWLESIIYWWCLLCFEAYDDPSRY